MTTSNSWNRKSLVTLGAPVVGGPKSNRAGIGARVTVTWGAANRRIREIKGGRGTTSQDALLAHFGLGDHRGTVDVTVRFLAKPPIEKTVKGVSLNQVLVVKEGE